MEGFRRHLLFGTIAVLATLVLLELVSRVAIPPERAGEAAGRYDYFMGMLRPAGAVWDEAAYVGVAKKEINTTYSLNALRLRGPEIERAKPAGATRVLCLGDSSTLGLGVAEEDSFARALETLLRGPGGGERVQVLNAGVAGFSSVQGFIRLREELLALAPDVVIVSFGLNDSGTTKVQLEDSRTTHYPDSFLLRRYLVAGGVDRPGWLRGLGIVRGLDMLVRMARPTLGGDEKAPRVTTGEFARYLAAIARLASESGARVVFLHIGAPPEYRMLMEGASAKTGWPYVDGTAEMARRAEEARTVSPYKERLAALGEEWGVDWAEVDDPARLVLWDSVHPNPIGGRFIAEALARAVAPLLSGETPPAPVESY